MNVILMSRPRGPKPGQLRFRITVVAVFIGVFAISLWALNPKAPGRAAVDHYIEVRTTDQHYRNCTHAKAEGRNNIPRWDPSYRASMDKDGDGLACEPYPRGGGRF